LVEHRIPAVGINDRYACDPLRADDHFQRSETALRYCIFTQDDKMKKKVENSGRWRYN